MGELKVAQRQQSSTTSFWSMHNSTRVSRKNSPKDHMSVFGAVKALQSAQKMRKISYAVPRDGSFLKNLEQMDIDSDHEFAIVKRLMEEDGIEIVETEANAKKSVEKQRVESQEPPAVRESQPDSVSKSPKPPKNRTARFR